MNQWWNVQKILKQIFWNEEFLKSKLLAKIFQNFQNIFKDFKAKFLNS